MPAPTTYTLAARIARTPLESLAARRRWNGAAGPLELEEYRALCDEELDRALDCATLAVWNHTTELEAARELLEAA